MYLSPNSNMVNDAPSRMPHAHVAGADGKEWNDYDNTIAILFHVGSKLFILSATSATDILLNSHPAPPVSVFAIGMAHHKHSSVH